MTMSLCLTIKKAIDGDVVQSSIQQLFRRESLMQYFSKKSGKFFGESKSPNTFSKVVHICIRRRFRFENLSVVTVDEQFPCYRVPRVNNIINMTSKIPYKFIFTLNQGDRNGSYVL